MLLFWKDIYSSWNHKIAFLKCTENDCADSSCNGENVLWHNDLLCLHVEKLVTDEKLLWQEDYKEVQYFISYARGRKVF